MLSEGALIVSVICLFKQRYFYRREIIITLYQN